MQGPGQLTGNQLSDFHGRNQKIRRRLPPRKADRRGRGREAWRAFPFSTQISGSAYGRGELSPALPSGRGEGGQGGGEERRMKSSTPNSRPRSIKRAPMTSSSGSPRRYHRLCLVLVDQMSRSHIHREVWCMTLCFPLLIRVTIGEPSPPTSSPGTPSPHRTSYRAFLKQASSKASSTAGSRGTGSPLSHSEIMTPLVMTPRLGGIDQSYPRMIDQGNSEIFAMFESSNMFFRSSAGVEIPDLPHREPSRREPAAAKQPQIRPKKSFRAGRARHNKQTLSMTPFFDEFSILPGHTSRHIRSHAAVFSGPTEPSGPRPGSSRLDTAGSAEEPQHPLGSLKRGGMISWTFGPKDDHDSLLSILGRSRLNTHSDDAQTKSQTAIWPRFPSLFTLS